MTIHAEIESTKDGPCVVQLFLDQEGLEILLLELQRFSEAGDHCHFFTEEWGGNGELATSSLLAESDSAHHLKITKI